MANISALNIAGTPYNIIASDSEKLGGNVPGYYATTGNLATTNSAVSTLQGYFDNGSAKSAAKATSATNAAKAADSDKLGGTAASTFVKTGTSVTLTASNASNLGGTAAATFVKTGTSVTLTASNASNLGGVAAANYSQTGHTHPNYATTAALATTNSAISTLQGYFSNGVANKATSAAAADKLKTERNIATTGDVSWTVGFDGSKSITAKSTVNNVPSAISWSGVSAEVDKKIGGVYKVMGNSTWANLTATTAKINGNVYNITGTVPAGTTDRNGDKIYAGDNVVYVTAGTAGWDKLASSVELGGYATTAALAVTNSAVSTLQGYFDNGSAKSAAKATSATNAAKAADSDKLGGTAASTFVKTGTSVTLTASNASNLGGVAAANYSQTGHTHPNYATTAALATTNSAVSTLQGYFDNGSAKSAALAADSDKLGGKAASTYLTAHQSLTGYAPKNHASTATTYGVGTTANYGHVKLATGDMKDAKHADGVAVSKEHTHSQYLTNATLAGYATKTQLETTNSAVSTLQGYFDSGSARSAAKATSATNAANAANAGNASHIYVGEHSTNNITYYPVWANGAGGTTRDLYTTTAKLQFNPNIGRLFVGSAVKIGNCTLQWNATTNAIDFNF